MHQSLGMGCVVGRLLGIGRETVHIGSSLPLQGWLRHAPGQGAGQGQVRSRSRRTLSPRGGNGKPGSPYMLQVMLGFHWLELGHREQGFQGHPWGCGLPKLQPIIGALDLVLGTWL